jgi:hypothetical protein
MKRPARHNMILPLREFPSAPVPHETFSPRRKSLILGQAKSLFNKQMPGQNQRPPEVHLNVNFQNLHYLRKANERKWFGNAPI